MKRNVARRLVTATAAAFIYVHDVAEVKEGKELFGRNLRSVAGDSYERVHQVFNTHDTDCRSFFIDHRSDTAQRGAKAAKHKRGLLFRSHGQNAPQILPHRRNRGATRDQIEHRYNAYDFSEPIHHRIPVKTRMAKNFEKLLDRRFGTDGHNTGDTDHYVAHFDHSKIDDIMNHLPFDAAEDAHPLHLARDLHPNFTGNNDLAGPFQPHNLFCEQGSNINRRG